MVRTRWIFPPPWTDRRRAEQAAMPLAWDAEHLIGLARESMVRGHYRVAMQRTVMVEAGGVALPQDLKDLVNRLWPGLPLREQARIHSLALAWAHFVRR
ncbi:hypothetical protein [Acidovorax sp. Root217]|uniref:hypothetical protein n=1 Tax=Acidovorax sp. Root217 TaxID=1736492 RepID=UPI00070E68C0|nr:hypothetical protein [Acidovorax sp. Root217]KRC17635.1 hypothetical protein ASE31_29655 [Acidovorax sp. Root217]